MTIGDGVEFGANVVVHDGCSIGAGTVVGDNAVLGKRPALGGQSTARRDPLPGLVVGERLHDLDRRDRLRRLDARRRA